MTKDRNFDTTLTDLQGNMEIEVSIRSLIRKLRSGARQLKQYAEQDDNIVYVTPTGTFVGNDKRLFDMRKYIMNVPSQNNSIIFIYRVEHHDHKAKGRYRMLDIDCSNDFFKFNRKTIRALAMLFFDKKKSAEPITIIQTDSGWHVVQNWEREKIIII